MMTESQPGSEERTPLPDLQGIARTLTAIKRSLIRCSISAGWMRLHRPTSPLSFGGEYFPHQRCQTHADGDGIERFLQRVLDFDALAPFMDWLHVEQPGR